MYTKENNYLLGISGGPDSMALLHYFYEHSLNFEVAHVNYQRRETADRDEKIVVDYCKQRSINYHLRRFPTNFVVQNFQHDAREFRYRFFQELMRERKLDVLVTAHHFDDVLETYVFQKRRKMFSESVGIAAKTEIFGLKVWRPFLDYNKKQLLEYCHKKKIPYGIDESNLDFDYSRNQIRYEISQLSKETYEKLVEQYKKDYVKWEKMKRKRRKIVKSWDFVVSYESYAKIEDSERFLYLRDWLIQEGVEAHDYSRAYLKDLDRQIIGRKIHRSLGEHFLCYSYGKIAVYQEKHFEVYFKNMEELQASSSEFLAIENFDDLHLESDDFPLILRNFKEGDSIQMSYGRKKINRFFIDEKIPLYERASWPILLNAEGEVIYVPKLGISVSFL